MGCTTVEPSTIFVITRSATLMRFDPPSSFTRIGQVACPGSGGSGSPNSMAVDHDRELQSNSVRARTGGILIHVRNGLFG
jgi:hypothetical protein